MNASMQAYASELDAAVKLLRKWQAEDAETIARCQRIIARHNTAALSHVRPETREQGDRSCS